MQQLVLKILLMHILTIINAILVVAVVPLISEKKGKVVGLDLINSFDFENPKSFKFNTV